MKLSSLLFLAPLLFACDVPDQHRHLRCTDESGTVVVDTTDLLKAPRQYETAWSWHNKDRTEYSELSIPPHKCSYHQHDIDLKDPDAKFPCDAEEPVLLESPE